MAPKVNMENINEFMKTIEETGTLFEYEDELFSPIEWLNMIINYMGADYAMNEKIAHYLQFMDKYNGLNKNDPLYPTILFHERITERNDVLMGALNFYNLRRNDVENLMENYLSV